MIDKLKREQIGRLYSVIVNLVQLFTGNAERELGRLKQPNGILIFTFNERGHSSIIGAGNIDVFRILTYLAEHSENVVKLGTIPRRQLKPNYIN